MDIFENLENLAVSEECFNDIMGIVEEIINEGPSVERVRKAAENSISARQAKFEKEAGDPDALPINPNAYKKAADKLFAAKKMAQLPKGDNRDYSKLRKAARKVRMDRDEQAEDAWAYSKPNPERDRLDSRSEKADLFAINGHGKMHESLQEEIKSIVLSRIKEDLATLTRKKFGTESPQYKKADELWDKAWSQAQDYFEKKGANHDLSTKQDLGIEKFDDNRLNQVAKREEGRNDYVLRSGLLTKRGGIIPKQVTPESSRFKPNEGTDKRDPESGVAKAIRRNSSKKK